MKFLKLPRTWHSENSQDEGKSYSTHIIHICAFYAYGKLNYHLTPVKEGCLTGVFWISRYDFTVLDLFQVIYFFTMINNQSNPPNLGNIILLLSRNHLGGPAKSQLYHLHLHPQNVCFPAKTTSWPNRRHLQELRREKFCGSSLATLRAKAKKRLARDTRHISSCTTNRGGFKGVGDFLPGKLRKPSYLNGLKPQTRQDLRWFLPVL